MKIKDKKRHILVDTLGLLLHVIVHQQIFKTAMVGFCCFPRYLGCSHS